jgi:hypothetical protein
MQYLGHLHLVFNISVQSVPGFKKVKVIAGLPLGYYASWPLFALSHNIIIWWAAEEIYPFKRFRDYAVLGDDVVIADPAVAGIYQNARQPLGEILKL